MDIPTEEKRIHPSSTLLLYLDLNRLGDAHSQGESEWIFFTQSIGSNDNLF